jgi:polar amino acid transport system permease protein
MLEIIRDNWLLMLIGTYPNGPLGGIAATLILSIVGIGLAFPLSVLIALAQLSAIGWIRRPATWLRYLVRSIPLVMLIFIIYFLLPIVIGRPLSGFTTMVCTLVIFEAMYLAEVVRAGIEALPNGQGQAAAALGLNYVDRMRYVILPQALYNMLPSMVGVFVTTIKDTSLGYVIGVQELTYAANQVNNSLLTQPFQVFFLLSLGYFAICFSLTRVASYLEKRIHRKRTAAQSHLSVSTVA